MLSPGRIVPRLCLRLRLPLVFLLLARAFVPSSSFSARLASDSRELPALLHDLSQCGGGVGGVSGDVGDALTQLHSITRSDEFATHPLSNRLTAALMKLHDLSKSLDCTSPFPDPLLQLLRRVVPRGRGADASSVAIDETGHQRLLDQLNMLIKLREFAPSSTSPTSESPMMIPNIDTLNSAFQVFPDDDDSTTYLTLDDCTVKVPCNMFAKHSEKSRGWQMPCTLPQENFPGSKSKIETIAFKFLIYMVRRRHDCEEPRISVDDILPFLHIARRWTLDWALEEIRSVCADSDQREKCDLLYASGDYRDPTSLLSHPDAHSTAAPIDEYIENLGEQDLILLRCAHGFYGPSFSFERQVQVMVD